MFDSLPKKLIKPFLASLVLSTSVSHAVIILDTTFDNSGFKEAEQLAFSPPFKPLMFLKGDKVDSYGSGTWIGNYQGHGYVLTAAHLFPKGISAEDYSYELRDGGKYTADKLILHPLWNENLGQRTGYDFAIVRLTQEVSGAGQPPILYDGHQEKNKLLTFVGYGYRGKGTGGQDENIDTKNRPAAGQGIIEFVKKADEDDQDDAGNYLGVWLPKEDGSIENPFDSNGITKPKTSLTALLGSGDSGGSAWCQIGNTWVLVGINSNGTGNAAYGDSSWFARVSHVESWIKTIVPNARFENPAA
ncbi:MAG: trypsin-like serine protease [Legionella sp.]